MKNNLIRVLSFVLALVMLMGILPMSVFASEEPMTLTVNSQTGVVGKNVEIKLDIKNNPGLTSLKFYVTYDSNLILQDVDFNSAFGAYVTTPEPYVNPQPITMISPLYEITAEGTLATMTFKIAEDAPDDYVANITVTYEAEDVYDEDGVSVPLTVVNGSVTLYHELPGDIDRDLSVTTKDAVLLFRKVAGWDVEVDSAALDVNGDNKVNTKDAVALFRYTSGWDGIPLYRGEVCEHQLVYKEETAATCAKTGLLAHWQCSLCEEYYSDADGNIEVFEKDLTINKLPHTEVIDKAVAPTYEATGLTEGSHCSVCNMILIEQKEVPALKTEYYSITYSNLKGAETPALNQYASHIGVLDEDMPKPERLGYEFLGWFDFDGNRIIDIPAGSKKDYHLYADWAPVTYNIRYIDAPVHSNPENYTIEQEIYLSAPKWSGLAFDYWTDEDGNVIEKIDKGSTGNLLLKAHWSTYRNRIVENNNNDKVVSVYDEASGKYYFACELGMISNVVISKVSSTYNKTTDSERTLTLEKSITEEKILSKSIAEMTAISVKLMYISSSCA